MIMEREELLKWRLSDWDSNIKSQADLDVLWEEIKTRKGLLFEIIQRVASGREVPVEVSMNYLSYQGDEYLVGYFHDITERKKTEEDINAAFQYARSLIEASLDLMVTISEEGQIISVNEVTVQITGVARAQLVGSDFSRYFTEPAKVHAVHQEVFTKGFVVEYPLAIQHVSGEVFDVLYNASPHLNKSGEMKGMLGVARNITERKQAEEQLHLAACVFTHAGEGIMITAADGTIIDVNDAFSQITSYSRDEVTGQNPRLLSSGRQGKDFYAALWGDLVEKGHWHGEV